MDTQREMTSGRTASVAIDDGPATATAAPRVITTATGLAPLASICGSWFTVALVIPAVHLEGSDGDDDLSSSVGQSEMIDRLRGLPQRVRSTDD
jgi:hypothetical protein